MGLRDKLKRLERLSEGEVITIPQQDGSVARFPQSAAREAYSNVMTRLGAGDDAPPEHPLIEAARNSSDPWWCGSVYAVDEDITAPIEDLSE
jgi:hypothetical protein